MLPCQRRWLGWWRVGSAATPTAQQRCWRQVLLRPPWTDVVSNRPIALNHLVVRNRPVVMNWPLWHPHPSALFWGPDGRRRCLVCHSAWSFYGSLSSCDVRLPPVDDICAVSELAVSTTSMRSWYRERQWHVALGRLAVRRREDM